MGSPAPSLRGRAGGEAVLFLLLPKHLTLAYEYRSDKQIGGKGGENTNDSHEAEVETHTAFRGAETCESCRCDD